MSFHLKGYKIIAKIGKGAFSDVYRVKDRQIGMHYAAKRLNEKCESLNDSRFYAEVNLLKTVPSHPNILSILGLVHDNDCLTFIMDLMDMNLFDLIHTRKRGLSESHARKILIQIIRGLEHLHRNGVFHRDIKPENILIKFVDGPHRKEIVQLADFGLIARITDPLPLQPYIATRWYRAPECMLTMGYYGPKIDVWAVGCCFYEMVTSEALFPGEDERHMLNLIHDVLGTPSQSVLAKFRMKRESFHFERRQPKDFRALIPLLSVGGVDVLKKTIVYLPEQRISTRKLLEHIYFEDFVTRKPSSSFSCSQSLYERIPQNRPVVPRDAKRIMKRNVPSGDASVWSGESQLTFYYVNLEDQDKRKRVMKRTDRGKPQ